MKTTRSIRLCALLAAAALLVACTKDNPDTGATPTTPTKPEPGDNAAGGAPAKVEAQPFSFDEVPAAVRGDKEVNAGTRFRDASGDNWLVAFNSMNDAGSQLRVVLARVDGDSSETVNEVEDKVEDCEFDVMLYVDEEALEVTDLDKDGTGEVWFAYHATCTSDVSPSNYRLVMFEGGDEYIIRGTTSIVDADGSKYGGEQEIDASLQNGPAAFLEHAKERWAELTKPKKLDY
ncbi:M949_RS01915 family surface polysaccharide biosynthesis protein [Haliangium ochraceum]|uniref:Lipoprotein n=1 Tax=Haliangium ochraceum (strain DSM 14365 / JCM 11303 / SMP-2) TaxID=502025 RepID=D0LJQ9_HALO1|nr:hypothetical protein [Haliangium ochraceum]ACY18416.1 hypothetical protein Hoch_5941 [Haliangium ochraceum DSM 14365]